MSSSPSSFQRLEARFYSFAAPWVYDRIVVGIGFRLLAGRLHDKVLSQGGRAVQAAGPRPILDLPIGTAFFTSRWGRSGLVVGADIAVGMVKKAKTRAAELEAEWLTTAQADIRHLPFRDRSFGAIMCTNGLQVMPPLPIALAELGRVLDQDCPLFVCMILFPLGALLPSSLRDRLPTVFKGRAQVLEELRSEGWTLTARDRSRLAMLFEAHQA